jgi:MoaA/NifB/PqqE/SkfB family radical SAM enzyme
MIVVWRVTGRCNLACPFCAYDRRLPGIRREIDAQAVEDFAGVLGGWRAANGERVLLSWLGGEPLLWTPLFDLSHRLHAVHGIAIGATTNGTALVRNEVRARIVESFSELTISIDGPREFHERLRGWPGGWHRLRRAVRELAAAAGHLMLRANVVLMQDNLPLFPALCEELADWGFGEISFNQLGGRDRPEFFPAHRLRIDDVDTLAALLPALRAGLAARGVRLCGGSEYLRRLDASARGARLAIDECAPPERFLFVDERGIAAPCSFTPAELGVPVTRIQTVAQLESLPARFEAQRHRARPAACDDCPSTQVFAKFAS